MNRFVVVRHGKTINNQAKRLSGWVDTPLLPEGLEPTDRVAAKLSGVSFAAVYSSDLGRAFMTAYYLCQKLGIDHEIIPSSGLREVNYGDAGNMLSADAYVRYPGIDSDTNFCPPNGESLAQMQARVVAEFVRIDQLHQSDRDQNILIVAHSGVMAALNSAYQGIDFGGHNISEGYNHDFVAEVTVDARGIATFGEYA